MKSYQEKLQSLKEEISKIDNENIIECYARFILDISETEVFVEEQAKKVFDEDFVHGDSYSSPGIEGIVSKMVEEIEYLRSLGEKEI